MQLAIRQGWVEVVDTAIVCIDFDDLHQRLEVLQQSFPANTHHAVAIKTMPLVKVLRQVVRWGYGLEAASLGEVALARAAGCPPERLVFDSPVKTKEEIAALCQDFQGSRVNVDNLPELERYERNVPLRLGVRVNPENTVAGVGYLDVGSHQSKFGVPVSHRKAIIDAALSHPKVEGLHVHSGSQMEALDKAVENISTIVQMAQEINAKQPGKIKWIDIGGGLPIDYHRRHDDVMHRYVERLKEKVPGLWSGQFALITEFGRWVYGHSGWLAAQVEYVKSYAHGDDIAMLHLGADAMLRECYDPGTWHHEMQVLTPSGKRKEEGTKKTYTLAGPLCFGGDIIDRNRRLPALSPSDWLIIEDAGANTIALWSRHCSRAFPKVLGYQRESVNYTIQEIRSRETVEEIVKFWGG